MLLSSLFAGSLALPKPSGPYSAGFIDYQWTPGDTPVLSPSCPVQFPVHPVFARIWYPSLPVEDPIAYSGQSYWIPSDEYHLCYENTVDTSATWFSGRRTSRYLLGNQLLYGVERAPINPDLTQGKVPVVLFSHGLLGFRNSHSSLFTDLASKGFVVIAMEHRDGSAATTVIPDGGSVKVKLFDSSFDPYDDYDFRNYQRQYREWEIKSALDLIFSEQTVPANQWRFESYRTSTSRTDLTPTTEETLGKLKSLAAIDDLRIAGYCLGGAAAISFSQKDPRVRRVTVISPLMYALGPVFEASRCVDLQIITTSEDVNSDNPGLVHRTIVRIASGPKPEGIDSAFTQVLRVIPGANHFHATELMALVHGGLWSFYPRSLPGIKTPSKTMIYLTPKSALEAINRMIVAFHEDL